MSYEYQISALNREFPDENVILLVGKGWVIGEVD